MELGKKTFNEISPPKQRRLSLKQAGVTDVNVMAKHLESNEYFQKFVKEHQEILEKTIEQTYGGQSHYAKNLHKSGISEPFKNRFGKYIHRANPIRSQNTKIFSEIQGENPLTGQAIQNKWKDKINEQY